MFLFLSYRFAHLGEPVVGTRDIGNNDTVPDNQFFGGVGLDGPPVFAVAMGLFASWLIIWMVMVIGVSGSGKIAYFTALFPYFVLLILLIGGCQLEGATTGLKYFYTPNFSKIMSPKAWFEAVGQCFFSLGIAFGGLVMFASYNKFHHKLGR